MKATLFAVGCMALLAGAVCQPSFHLTTPNEVSICADSKISKKTVDLCFARGALFPLKRRPPRVLTSSAKLQLNTIRGGLISNECISHIESAIPVTFLSGRF
jgi:hypothetical protein